MITSRVFSASALSRWYHQYFKVLGVTANASESEVKRAYFTLAKQYHPDVNRSADAQARFSEINTAYEALKNAPRHESQTFKTGAYHSFDEMEDFLDEFEEFFHTQRRPRKPKKDRQVTVEIPFMVAIHGGFQQVTFNQRVVCNSCKGTRVGPNSSSSKCPHCGGKGTTLLHQGRLMFRCKCPVCHGAGRVTREPCRTCSGDGEVWTKRTESIEVPAGAPPGYSLYIQKRNSTLKVKLSIARHRKFVRKGLHIFSDLPVSISQAVLGAAVDVQTVYGPTVIQVPAGTKPGDTLTLEGKGVKDMNQRTRGNHILNVKLIIPRHLSAAQRQAFEQVAQSED